MYAKKPFAGPDHVFRYLGRYTHRVGIANSRLVDVTSEHVTFRTKNGETITLAPTDFLARFVQHVLPRGYVKIRHYGLCASSNVGTRLERARQLLRPTPIVTKSPPATTWIELLLAISGRDVRRCTRCDGVVTMLPVPRHAPDPLARAPPS